MQLSFIILNYNTADLTCQCIASIRRHVAAADYEVIVVDNCSGADDVARLQQTLPQDCLLVRSRQNLGFGGGNMLGAGSANGRYLCFLNSDIVLEEDCVTPLLAELEQDASIGCITPQQYDGQHRLVRAFNHEHTILNKAVSKSLLERLMPRRYPSRRRLYTAPFAVHNVNGCFMLFPADAFWACGGFDVNIFLYCEEYDIAMRLARKGYRCVVDPRYGFLHLQGQAAGKAYSLTRIEGFISDLYTYRKYHGRLSWFIYWLVMLFKVLPKYRIWYVLPTMLMGGGLSRSMRHRR